MVGGVALVVLGAILIWYFSTKSTRKRRKSEKEFDFNNDPGVDPWDPAVGLAAAGKRGGGGGGGGGGSKYKGAGEVAAARERSRSRDNNGEVIAMGAVGTGGGSKRRTSIGRKKLSPADEQFAYYASVPAPPANRTTSPTLTESGTSELADAGIAGVGLGGGSGPLPAPAGEERNPYGGVALEGPREDGGYAIANQLAANHNQAGRTSQGYNKRPPGGQQRNPAPPPARAYTNSGPLPSSNSNGSLQSLQSLQYSQPPSQQQYARVPIPPPQQQQPYQPSSQPLGYGQSPYSQPSARQPSYNNNPVRGNNLNAYPYAQNQPPSIPYTQNTSQHPTYLPPSQRFSTGPDTIASPAPSHLSIPALGAWNQTGSPSEVSSPGGGGGGGGRRGPLRVTNSDEANEEDYDRWTGSGGAYDGLMEGLSRNASTAPTYRTHE